MAYNKTVWVNGEEPAINAENLNKIEAALESHDTDISDLKSQISDIEDEIESGTGSGLTGAQWRNMISLFRAAVYDTSVLANPQTVVDELEDSYDNIPSTSITLSQSSLTFLTADTQSVTATLRPNTTTDSISAVSSNPSVASVSVNNKVVTVTPVSNGSVTVTVTTQSGISATISVVVDMPQTFSITNTLTGCTNSNQQAVITEGSSYEGTLVFADSSYRLSSIEVLMGFDDITETAWDSETNTVSISNVTGDISITATAVTPVLYSLAQPLVTSGEASNFVNTNVKIGQTDTSFTVIAYITTTVAAGSLGSNKYIISARDAANSCFGFVVRTTNYCITINNINSNGTPKNYNNIQNYKIVVRHTAGELNIKGAIKCFDQQNASIENRTFTGTSTFTEFVSHSNPIYLGKRIDGYGVCNDLTIEKFKVLNYVLTDEEVNTYLATESAEV